MDSDYDADPGRFSLVASTAVAGDSHPRVAARLAAEGARVVLDIGCGRGRLAPHLAPGTAWVGLDRSPAQLSACPARPVIAADAHRLPFKPHRFDAVAALWMLYHSPDPRLVLSEAMRVLRPGGLFVACTDSRRDAAELVAERPATPFDAEDAPDLLGRSFGDVEVDRWTATLHLADERAVAAFLRAMRISSALRRPVRPPLTVTKRGCVLYARRP